MDTLKFYITTLGNILDNNEDAVASILAYSIVNSMLDFNLHTTSEKEMSYRQARAIYEGLEAAIQNCRTRSYNEVLHSMRTEVHPDIQRLIREKEDYTTSPLLGHIVDYLTSRKINCEDSLRRAGITIIKDTNERLQGRRGKKYITLLDYQTIEKVFTE